VQYVLLPISELKSGGKGRFVVERKKEEPLVYEDIEKLKQDYAVDLVSFGRTLRPCTAKLPTEANVPS
jgi:tyrosyl-tRNA synthetase